MSGRALAITKRQAKTLLKAAEEARGVVEVNPLTGVIRLIPAVLAGDVKQIEPRIDREPEGTM